MLLLTPVQGNTYGAQLKWRIEPVDYTGYTNTAIRILSSHVLIVFL